MSEREGRGRRRDASPPGEAPPRVDTVGSILGSVLAAHGIAGRVAQQSVIPEWPSVVGPQIAQVTVPQVVRGDGTLVVAVATHGWMQELSLMGPQLLERLNGVAGRPAIRRIHWQLGRPDEPLVGGDRGGA